jgi:hypothetical protein
MQSNRSVLAAVLSASALLVLPVALQAKPRAVYQPRNGQRVVANVVIQLQVQRAIKHRRHYHTLRGTVVSVHQNKQVPGTGTIKLRVYPHHRKHANQVVAQARANGNVVQVVVKKAPCRAAASVGQQKKRHGRVVKIHYGKGTKFAVTVKGVFNHLVSKTVGSGKNKTKVVYNQPKVETHNLPSHVRHVQSGQHVRVVLHDPHQAHNAKDVQILHASVVANGK